MENGFISNKDFEIQFLESVIANNSTTATTGNGQQNIIITSTNSSN